MRWVCLFFAVSGLVFSIVLLSVHVQGVAGSGGALAGICSEGGGCEQVMESRWSYFPPIEESAAARARDPAKHRGIPVALLGLFYFTILGGWLLLVGRAESPGNWANRAILGLGVAGLLGSVGFMILMGAAIKAWCPYCLMTHGANFCLVAGLFYYLRPARTSDSGKEVEFAGLSGRYAGVVAVALMAVCVSEWSIYRASAAAAANRVLTEALAAFQENVNSLEAVFYQAETEDIEIREEDHPGGADPVIDPAPGYRNTVVVFGDAECPSCARFHRLLRDEIEPIYGGHLRIVYKHFPLTGSHPNALPAAYALEAARRQGKFWEYYEALHAVRDRLATVDLVELVRDTGLEPGQFVADMNDPATAERVEEDIQLGRQLGVDATPSVFLNSRKVDKSIRNLLTFWEKQADRLREYRLEHGEEWLAAEAGEISGAASRNGE